MTRMIDMPANDLIEKAAKELENKSEVKAPEWAIFVKTGNHKERPPVNDNWWYVRAAAVLRTVAIRGPIGVSKLRTKFGGKQNRGHKPSIFVRGSGNILRKMLQQLEACGFVKQEKVGNHSGRVLTKEGKEFLNSFAAEEKEEAPKKAPAKKTTKKAPAKKTEETVEQKAEETQEAKEE